MEMGRPQGTGPRLSGRAEQRASSQWKELRQREKGAGQEWWRAKEQKSHMPPRKIPGRAGEGGGGSTCRKQVPRHGTASLAGFFSELDDAKEREEIYSLPAVQRLTTLLLLSG